MLLKNYSAIQVFFFYLRDVVFISLAHCFLPHMIGIESTIVKSLWSKMCQVTSWNLIKEQASLYFRPIYNSQLVFWIQAPQLRRRIMKRPWSTKIGYRKTVVDRYWVWNDFMLTLIVLVDFMSALMVMFDFRSTLTVMVDFRSTDMVMVDFRSTDMEMVDFEFWQIRFCI